MEKAILFVDDEALILMSMKSQVKRHLGDSYRYETALDASEAMQIIEELVSEGVKILIVISDWLMPNIKGDEFLRQVHQRYPEIQKIIITGHADIASVEALKKEINLYSYLKKPWDEKELVTTITSALN
ncbi:hypothetical protein CH373_07980 [Leptospira perolatii]|uniref:Response regulatory domain-containing protein n=1 Tax=Leptospira perolatii TaxID=2023191 RepID=A0A2M9ZN18_9LEPT|nr:response regulator [Leptospira perolatii]PJZ68935.1 hypothetical protein CH360_13735 [Leptospira perolatii]PJZ73447.1 hypothetical protein CH373_07980 [Leptospira perolatii]